MKRIFSIQFYALGNSCKAIVSFNRSTPSYIHIQFLDEIICSLFSTRHIRCLGEEFKSLPFSQSLFCKDIWENITFLVETELHKDGDGLRDLSLYSVKDASNL